MQELFDAVSEKLVAEDADVARGKIMHSFGLGVGGKFFAFVRQDRLVLKLPAARVSELVASGEGEPFDAGKGRPMREWVSVKPADEASCAVYLREARDFVGGLAGGL
jgi:TfoX/Sxy family transcriptional regulator of competence genes